MWKSEKKWNLTLGQKSPASVFFIFFIYFSLVCLLLHSELKLKNLLCSANGGERSLPFLFICFAVCSSSGGERRFGFMDNGPMRPKFNNGLRVLSHQETSREGYINRRSVIRKGIETQISLCSTGNMRSPLSYLYQSLKYIQVWGKF